MSATLLHYAVARFEAALRLPGLAPGHRLGRLHGHGYRVRASAASATGLHERLAAALAPLGHSLLNDTVALPTDAGLAGWIAERLGPGVAVAVRGDPASGVERDAGGTLRHWHRFRFESAHRLPNVPEGHPCGRLHGHGFEVVLHARFASSPVAPGLEAEALAAAWRPLHAELHARCLNDIPGLENPTSELLARWILERLEPALPGLCRVTVRETASAGCDYDGQRFAIWKDVRFEAAVPASDGGGEVLGHSYLARLHLCAPLDAVLGWTIDFGDVRAAFTPVFLRLDHQRLDLSAVARPGPVELLGWMREACAPHLPALARIDLHETPETGATLAWGPLAAAAAGPP